MYFREIDIAFGCDKNNSELRKVATWLNLASDRLEYCFIRNLKKNKFKIGVDSNLTPDGRIIQFDKTEYVAKIYVKFSNEFNIDFWSSYAGNVLQVDVKQDIEDFFRLGVDERRNQIFLSFEKIIYRLCEHYKWDIEPFKIVFKACYDQNLEAKWQYKDKLFRSPDKQRYCSLNFEYGDEYFLIFVKIFNKQKEFVMEKEVRITEPNWFYNVEVFKWVNDNLILFKEKRDYKDYFVEV